MKCFRHPQSDALGTCKYCFKGVCAECAGDSGIGLVCSPQCETEVRSLKALVDRNKQAFPLVAKAHMRNTVLLALFAVAFLAYAVSERADSSLYPFLLAVGIVMLVGAAFSLFMGRKYAKASREHL